MDLLLCDAQHAAMQQHSCPCEHYQLQRHWQSAAACAVAVIIFPMHLSIFDDNSNIDKIIVRTCTFEHVEPGRVSNSLSTTLQMNLSVV